MSEGIMLLIRQGRHFQFSGLIKSSIQFSSSLRKYRRPLIVAALSSLAIAVLLPKYSAASEIVHHIVV